MHWGPKIRGAQGAAEEPSEAAGVPRVAEGELEDRGRGPERALQHSDRPARGFAGGCVPGGPDTAKRPLKHSIKFDQ